MNKPNKTPVQPSQEGFYKADHILRRAIPYYSPDDYVADVGFGSGFELRESFRLLYPATSSPAWGMSISFTRIAGRDDVLWVRSTNWRVEHEPNGAMKIESARRLYARLVAVGMQPF